MTKLVIVESPAKAKTINKYLGSDYKVVASLGHVRDLPIKELGIDLDNEYSPTYVVNDDKKDVVKNIVNLAKKADEVLLAGDPDREGEAISWHLEEIVKKHCKNVSRVTFNEITKNAILEAVRNKRKVDIDMVDSQQTRRLLDRIVGYQLSPWISNALGGRLSAGRVQSVALRVIVDREREIENFKPEEFWKVFAQLKNGDNAELFEAEYLSKDGVEEKLKNKEDVDTLLSSLEGATYQVDDVEKKTRLRKAAPPFTTSTLQQEAVRKLGWDSKKAMKVAQGLYEGVEVRGESTGLITYMRTDSTRISPEFQAEAKQYISDRWGFDYVPKSPNVYKTKGDAQDAHEAIRPTNLDYSPDEIVNSLDADQMKLYSLIWNRFIASQMVSAEYDTVVAKITTDKGHLFKANGSTLKSKGYMVVYQEDEDVEEGEVKKDDNDKTLPPLDKGDVLALNKLIESQRFTKPPSRYTEATLIKELERKGVGRPSTYASIISTLTYRNYVTVQKTRFNTTELGRGVVDHLVEYFPDVMDVEFTSELEDKLDEIADGKHYWVDVMDDYYTPFSQALFTANQKVKPVVREDEAVGENCPECESPLVYKKTKSGDKFIACSSYPNCTYTKFLPSEKQKTGVMCDCGGEFLIVEYTKGKKKEKFASCSNNPTCKEVRKVVRNKVMPKSVFETDKKCPKCDSDMVIREVKGSRFYACTSYPDCKYTQTIVKESDKTIDCDKCGKPMILRKGKYGHFYSCTGYPDCSNIKKANSKGELVKEAEKTDEKCDKCGSMMTLRDGKNGKFYACSGFPKCKNTKPYFAPGEEIKKCPKCDKPMILKKSAKGEFYGCSGYPTCKTIVNK